MASAHGTTDKTANAFKGTSMKHRPATSGNKNVNATAKRKPATGMVPGQASTAPLAGPDKGSG
jgi:hypothetical protein